MDHCQYLFIHLSIRVAVMSRLSSVVSVPEVRITQWNEASSFEVIFTLARVQDVSAMTFFVFAREENDEMTLRRKIDGWLCDLSVFVLESYRLLTFVVDRLRSIIASEARHARRAARCREGCGLRPIPIEGCL
jgi:hypothetical protein